MCQRKFNRKESREHKGLNPSMESTAVPEEKLCLSCGLCCNGVIFADVRLQPHDDKEKLEKLGLDFSLSTARVARFRQRCSALDGCRCRIYSERPEHCRSFECLLLKRVKAGQLAPDAALEVIATGIERVEKVRSLLCELGDHDEDLPLGARFQRTARRLEKRRLTEQMAGIYGQLTLAFHDLNLFISEVFYR
jgi:Fe-S-cluster containining protein